jgi:hypothetical protein
MPELVVGKTAATAGQNLQSFAGLRDAWIVPHGAASQEVLSAGDPADTAFAERWSGILAYGPSNCRTESGLRWAQVAARKVAEGHAPGIDRLSKWTANLRPPKQDPILSESFRAFMTALLAKGCASFHHIIAYHPTIAHLLRDKSPLALNQTHVDAYIEKHRDSVHNALYYHASVGRPGGGLWMSDEGLVKLVVPAWASYAQAVRSALIAQARLISPSDRLHTQRPR